MTEESKTVQKWADPAMFQAAPSDATNGPRVYLLAAPADPLGSISAAAKMYVGEVVRDLAEITDEDRRHYLAEMQKTKLAMPLEAVTFHFLIDNVTRAFTHQLVRQRTAAYAQESMRFAVVEDDFISRVALPPSLAGTTGAPAREVRARYEANRKDFTERTGETYSEFLHDQFTIDFQRLPKPEQWRAQWDFLMQKIQDIYTSWVNEGMPAEDARAILPTNITTRVHYITNLRALLDHAGNRLCTQAQFEWRLVFAQLAKALRDFDSTYYINKSDDGIVYQYKSNRNGNWQYGAIADLLKPVCYQQNKCPMKADFDRKCKIRNRVDDFARHNISSNQWGREHIGGDGLRMDGIFPAEWLADPGAAR